MQAAGLIDVQKIQVQAGTENRPFGPKDDRPYVRVKFPAKPGQTGPDFRCLGVAGSGVR